MKKLFIVFFLFPIYVLCQFATPVAREELADNLVLQFDTYDAMKWWITPLGKLSDSATDTTHKFTVTGNIGLSGEGTAIYLDYGSSGAEDHDVMIYFGDDGNNTAHYFGWDDGDGAFKTGNNIYAIGWIKSDNGFYASGSHVFDASGNIYDTTTDAAYIGITNNSSYLYTGTTSARNWYFDIRDAAEADAALYFGDTGNAGEYATIDSLGIFYETLKAGITAVNPGGQGDGVLTAQVNVIATVGTADDAVTLPPCPTVTTISRTIKIINNGANQLEIWPSSGDNAGAGVNTAITLAAGSNLILVTIDATNWEQL